MLLWHRSICYMTLWHLLCDTQLVRIAWGNVLDITEEMSGKGPWLTHTQTHGQLLTGYTVSLASWAEKLNSVRNIRIKDPKVNAVSWAWSTAFGTSFWVTKDSRNISRSSEHGDANQTMRLAGATLPSSSREILRQMRDRYRGATKRTAVELVVFTATRSSANYCDARKTSLLITCSLRKQDLGACLLLLSSGCKFCSFRSRPRDFRFFHLFLLPVSVNFTPRFFNLAELWFFLCLVFAPLTDPWYMHTAV